MYPEVSGSNWNTTFVFLGQMLYQEILEIIDCFLSTTIIISKLWPSANSTKRCIFNRQIWFHKSITNDNFVAQHQQCCIKSVGIVVNFTIVYIILQYETMQHITFHDFSRWWCAFYGVGSSDADNPGRGCRGPHCHYHRDFGHKNSCLSRPFEDAWWRCMPNDLQ